MDKESDIVNIVDKSEETKLLENDQEEMSINAKLSIEDKDKFKIMFHCDMCSYKCKKEITLKKHLHTKHEDQKWKTGEEIFTNSMELVMHVAMEQYSGHHKTKGKT